MFDDQRKISAVSVPQGALNLVARACLNYMISVFWGEPNREPGMNSASGVLLRLERPLLVTAEHVITSFIERAKEQESLELMVGKAAIDGVAERIIGRSKQPDLITLDLSGVDIKSFAEHLVFYEPVKWPPSPVINGSTVLLGGFPKAYRKVLHAQKAIKFNSWQLFAKVTAVSDNDFTCVIDVRDRQSNSPRAIWPQSYGAISGGPVFAFRGELMALEFVGIVYEVLEDFHMIKAHHSKLIAIDGSLETNHV